MMPRLVSGQAEEPRCLGLRLLRPSAELLTLLTSDRERRGEPRSGSVRVRRSRSVTRWSSAASAAASALRSTTSKRASTASKRASTASKRVSTASKRASTASKRASTASKRASTASRRASTASKRAFDSLKRSVVEEARSARSAPRTRMLSAMCPSARSVLSRWAVTDSRTTLFWARISSRRTAVRSDAVIEDGGFGRPGDRRRGVMAHLLATAGGRGKRGRRVNWERVRSGERCSCDRVEQRSCQRRRLDFRGAEERGRCRGHADGCHWTGVTVEKTTGGVKARVSRRVYPEAHGDVRRCRVRGDRVASFIAISSPPTSSSPSGRMGNPSSRCSTSGSRRRRQRTTCP